MFMINKEVKLTSVLVTESRGIHVNAQCQTSGKSCLTAKASRYRTVFGEHVVLSQLCVLHGFNCVVIAVGVLSGGTSHSLTMASLQPFSIPRKGCTHFFSDALAHQPDTQPELSFRFTPLFSLKVLPTRAFSGMGVAKEAVFSDWFTPQSITVVAKQMTSLLSDPYSCCYVAG